MFLKKINVFNNPVSKYRDDSTLNAPSTSCKRACMNPILTHN